MNRFYEMKKRTRDDEMVKKSIEDSFNAGTRKALAHNVAGYAGEEGYCHERIQDIKTKYALDKVYRFDLGQNSDGCEPRVIATLRRLLQAHDVHLDLNCYPSMGKTSVKNKIASLHQVDPSLVCFSAGIEQAVGLIASAFLSVGDQVVVNQPSFFIFDNFSRRVGAHPIQLPLHEKDHFDWTSSTFDQLKNLLLRANLKIVWIANPNNPTGRAIEQDLLKDIIREATKHNTLVVLDEAYGEYLDPANGVNSGSALLASHPNLIVLRTFSKAFGLATLRLGYSLVNNEKVSRAIRTQGYNYPVSQFSYELASTALDHLDFLETTRKALQQRRERLFEQLNQLDGISVLDTDSSIFMFKHQSLAASQIQRQLEAYGVLLARIPGMGQASKSYLRVNIGRTQDNDVLVASLKKLIAHVRSPHDFRKNACSDRAKGENQGLPGSRDCMP